MLYLEIKTHFRGKTVWDLTLTLFLSAEIWRHYWRKSGQKQPHVCLNHSFLVPSLSPWLFMAWYVSCWPQGSCSSDVWMPPAPFSDCTGRHHR